MPTREATIRPLQPADAVAIHAIHTACLQITLATHYSADQRAAWGAGRTPEGYLRGAAAGEIYLVAEEAGAVIAYANWQEDELLSLFVHPDHQRQGLGRRLFRACDAAATLTRVKATLGATAFYEAFGFRMIRPDIHLKRDVPIPHILMARS